MATYDREAREYAALTCGYDGYPGLDAEVAVFHHRAPDGTVLDAGCGAGRDSAGLARLGRRVIALDVSAGLLAVAAARDDLGPPGAVAFVRGDLLSLPIGAGRLAGIWACASLVHVPGELHPRVLAAAAACLSPGGVLAVSMKAGQFDGMARGGSASGARWLSEAEPDRFCTAMSSVGLTDVGSAPSGRGTWYVATGIRV